MRKEKKFLIKVNVSNYGSTSPYTKEIVFRTSTDLYDNEICDVAIQTIEQYLPYKTEENLISIRAGTILLILAAIIALILIGIYV